MISHNIKRILSFVVVFCIAMLLSVLVTFAYTQNKIKLEHSQMQQVATTSATKVGNVLSKLLYKTQVLSALVIQNDGEIRDFERIAATIVDDPSIKNIILAPNGVVSSVYPLAGNEQVVGLNYFTDKDGNKEAMLAKITGKLILGGPFNLVQGGQALVGRLPVYLTNAQGEKSFWGLVSVTLNYPQALEAAMSSY